MATPTRETKIWEALRLHVVGVGATVGLPVSYPMENYAPNVTEPFLLCSYLPNISERPYMGTESLHLYNGIIQIDVMLPLNGLTLPYAMRLAGEVVLLFPEDAPMRFQDITVRVTKRGDVAQGYRDGAMWRTPVTIRWQCWA